MALKVWLPLDGDLIQQGTAETTFSGTPLWKSYGKIGNSALNLQNRITCTTPALNGTQFFTVTFWARIEDNPDSTANWMDVIGFTDQTSTGSNGQFRFETGYGNAAYGGVHWHDNTTNAIIDGSYIYNNASEFNNWHHIAITVSNEKVCSYYDGELKQTQTSYLNKGHLTGNWWIGESTTRGCIQDVRIYDNALSSVGIKEISRGLVLHYKLDGPNANLLPSNESSLIDSTQSFEFSGWVKNFYTTNWVNENLVVGQQYTLSYTVTCLEAPDLSTHTLKETRHSPIYVRQGSGWSQVTTTSDGIKTTNMTIGESRTYKCTFTFDTVNQTQPYYGFCGYTAYYKNNETDATVYSKFRIDNLKLEKGDKVTSWCPNVTDDLYSTLGYNTNIIEDSSGYNHNGEIINTLTIFSNTPRYGTSTYFSNSAHIRTLNFNLPSNIWTVSCWYYRDTNPSAYEAIFCLSKGNGADANKKIAAIPNAGRIWFKGESGSSSISKLNISTWTMLTMTCDGTTVKIYENSFLIGSFSAGNPMTECTDLIIGARANSVNATSIAVPYTGGISDFRIYCTPLLDTDIKQLYNVGMKVDNLGGVHGFELNESGNNRITKTGILEGNLMGESEFSHYLKYDSNIYIEPDGSAWVKIYHHNNPKGGSFSSTNDFVNGVYIDENRWFNVNVCNYIDKWELMVKGKYTAEDNEWKIRWIQNVNPMTATFAEVAVANITKITNSGGELYGSSPSAWGGLYAKKGSAYLTANNGTNGNWWGAVGSYSVYQNGIPGWGTSGTITTTGFNDLYVRIDNVDFNTVNASNTKNKVWNASTFIEM